MKFFRNKWMEFTPEFGFRIQYHVASYFDRRPMIAICLIWGSFFIHLPFNTGIDECDHPTYGFYWYASAIRFNIGEKVKCLHMPWSFNWYRTSYLLKDYTWDNEFKGDRKDYWKEENRKLLWSEKHPYIYILKNAEVQQRIATISVEVREWRRRCLMFIPLFNIVRKTIKVDFDLEVGESTGSWKGGTTGCGWNLQEGELPYQALRRMEKERIFK